MSICGLCNTEPSSSRQAKYCDECRYTIYLETSKRRVQRALEAREASNKHKGTINPKWLIRGKISNYSGMVGYTYEA